MIRHNLTKFSPRLEYAERPHDHYKIALAQSSLYVEA